MRWNHWALLGLGAWLIVSPWVLGFSDLNLVVWNVVAAGCLTVMLVLWNLSSPQRPASP